MIKTESGRDLTDADWAIFLARGASDTLYAVITTGIVCRPGCPARTPLRKNVRLFATLEAATGAGFRPCKRCKPTADTPESSQSA